MPSKSGESSLALFLSGTADCLQSGRARFSVVVDMVVWSGGKGVVVKCACTTQKRSNTPFNYYYLY